MRRLEQRGAVAFTAMGVAVVVIFVVAAVLTPGPDVASQLLMAAPLLVLYVLSIGVAYVVARPAVVATTDEVATPDDGAASPP